jgi:2-phospho-L-lactate guanylyltransferase
MRTVAVLPVKRFDRAKQRLAGEIAPSSRRLLAEAMLSDVLDALSRARAVADVIVVSAERRARELAAARGMQAVGDPVEEGQSAAAELGLQRARDLGYERALLVPGDCPALEPAEVDALLARPARRPGVAIVPDRHGAGTNALLLAPLDVIRPAFGPGSLDAHVTAAEAAAVPFDVEPVPSLALDIDTRDDLLALRDDVAAGARSAPRATAVLERLTRGVPAASA